MPKKALGALIIHGFTDRLDSIQIIKSAIEELGLPTGTPILRGHEAESPEALRGVTWQDWAEDARTGLRALLQNAEKAMVIGNSLGGLITLNLAAENPEKIDSIVLAATPIKINSPLAPGQPLSFLTPVITKLLKKWNTPPTYVDTEQIKHHTSYPWVPMDSIATLLDFTLAARAYLPAINLPTLIIQSTNDSTAAPESARIIYESISTPPEEKEIIWFEETDHEMFRDLEREAVVTAIKEYVKQRIN